MSNEEFGGLVFGGVFFVFAILFFLIIIVGIYVVKSIIYSKIFEKTGKDKILGWVPFYRDYILLETTDLNWYWILIIYAPTLVAILTSWIPFLGIISTSVFSLVARVASANMYYNLNKKFKNEDIIFVLFIFFPLIMLGIMAFSEKYKYYKEVEVQPDGFLGDLGIISKKQNVNTNTNNNDTVASEVIKDEEVKVTKEEVKETKKEEVVEVKEETKEEEPKKKTTTKKKTTNKKNNSKKETKED